MKKIRVGVMAAMVVLAVSVFAQAPAQVWKDDDVNNSWSTNELSLNWDYGTAWTNGNSAVFSGGAGLWLGETVDVSATVTVANVTFQTNGYVIADSDNDGALLLAGAPSVFTVVGAGNTGTVTEAIGGGGGLTKAGNGTLNLTVTNTYAGTTEVASGVLRLAPAIALGLGLTGTGNQTVVGTNATLDLNGCYVNGTTDEKFTISGAGADGKGALINTGPDMTNRDLNEVILSGDATVGGPRRIDIGTLTGNGYTFTKIGALQLCTRNVANVEIVIREGTLTLLDNANALGGSTPGDTTVYGGTLNCWNTKSYAERITFFGGTLSQGNTPHTFYLAGNMTVNSNVLVNSASARGVEISGFVDGLGGFTQSGDGWFIVTGNTNTYAGPTIVNSGKSLWVGRTNLFSGVLGSGALTNNGTVYAYSSRITDGSIFNGGTLNSYTGLLCAGSVVNNGSLYFSRGDAFTLTNNFSGWGTIYTRYNPSITLSGGASTNSGLRLGSGTLTLTNNAFFRFTGEIQVADRFAFPLPDPTNVTGVINVGEGCTLCAQAITFGNGTNVVNGGMTSFVNQAGDVITTGRAAEDNGIRLGHYPQAYSVYNMMDGTLTVGADYDLCCATDGAGWFRQTGGEVFTKRVMLNERGGNGGYGRLSVAGGVLNIGSLTGSMLALSNGITADPGAPYLVEFGGAGGIIRAVTNVTVSVSNTLYGVAADAVTFDTAGWNMALSGNSAGAGGLNKSGAGVLTLSGTNTYSGATRVLEGALTPAWAGALPAGGEVRFGVASDDSGGRLYAAGDLPLNGIVVGVANPDELDESKSYTIATYGGALTGAIAGDALPGPWYVYYDWAGKRILLRAAVGTVILLR